jgi:DNA-binding NarL/FixJ family response regulator
VIIYSAFDSQALALPARVAGADAVVDKTQPVSSLLAAIRLVAGGEVLLPAVPHDAYATATARLENDDLPVFAMLLGGESLPDIAGALRTDTTEVAWRAQRIIGRLRPGKANRPDQRELESVGGRVPDLPHA